MPYSRPAGSHVSTATIAFIERAKKAGVKGIAGSGNVAANLNAIRISKDNPDPGSSLSPVIHPTTPRRISVCSRLVLPWEVDKAKTFSDLLGDDREKSLA